MFWCFDVLSFEFYSIDVNLIKPQRLMYLCDFWVLNPNYIRRNVVKMLMKKKKLTRNSTNDTKFSIRWTERNSIYCDASEMLQPKKHTHKMCLNFIIHDGFSFCPFDRMLFRITLESILFIYFSCVYLFSSKQHSKVQRNAFLYSFKIT